MDTFQAFIELVPHHKYTLVYFGRHGFLNQTNFYLRGVGEHRISGKSYIRLVIKPSNASIRDVLLNPLNQFVLWDGWVTPSCELIIKFEKRETSMGILNMGMTWAKYDPRYLNKAMASIPEKPMIWNVREPKEEQFFDYCYVS